MFQIVVSESEAQAFYRDDVRTAAITKQMSASTRIFNLSIFASSHGRACSGHDRNAIGIAECRCEAGISIAADSNCGAGPDLGDETIKTVTVFCCQAAREKDAHVICIARQQSQHSS